jgi:hypothetical protein
MLWLERTELFSIPFIRMIRVRVYASTRILLQGSFTIPVQAMGRSSIGMPSMSKGLKAAMKISPIWGSLEV